MNIASAPDTGSAHSRLTIAEREGLRLAILCRTLAVGAGFLWVAGASLVLDYRPSPWAFVGLGGFTLIGVLHALAIGTDLDRPWMKYAIYALDVAGICAAFVIVPVSVGQDVPQIFAFRAYGIYYLFPLIAMATLSLSPWLVLWTGTVAVVGWWTAFWFVVSGMDNTLSWADMPPGATTLDYETVFLSADFIGRGNRVEETGFLFISAATLALAVWRARRVYLAQLAAQSERDRIATTLGRYVPEAIARRLINDPSALKPQQRDATILITDVAGFTAYSASRSPTEVIDSLNRFLAECADAISLKNGVVIHFTGDGLMAAFGTPIESATSQTDAIEAAAGLKRCARRTDFDIRIGIASGPVASGSIGSADRQAFTVYGDTVNRAARLEAHGKVINRTVLVDEAVARHLDPNSLEPFPKQQLRGLAGAQDIYAVIDAG